MLDKMILIDLETQNIFVKSGIYEVGCLVLENYEVVDQLYLGEKIPEFEEERKYGFGFYDISKEYKYISMFKKFIGKYQYPLVAHNCYFDRKFLIYYQWIDKNYPTYCSIEALKASNIKLDKYSLEYLVQYFKIANTVEHSAMSDIENLYKILKLLKPKIWKPINNNHNKPIYSKVRARPLEEIDLNIDNTDILKGEVVCFSGQGDYPRNIMEEIAIKNGASISSSITKKTTLLVIGCNPGSKLAKATDKGINIVTVVKFMEILNLIGKELYT